MNEINMNEIVLITYKYASAIIAKYR